jgi:hypothetical protein
MYNDEGERKVEMKAIVRWRREGGNQKKHIL